jgi:Uma2 family endonuclease
MNVDFASVATIPVPDDIEALILRPGLHPLSDERFAEFCAQYPELRIEMNREGEMMIMLPVVSRGGRRNFNLTGRFFVWSERDGSGVGFDSSTGFTLRNGAKRSPDVSWIKRERWDALSEEQKDDFAPICPDFVVELRSKSDRLKHLQEKMEEYIENGAALGWLIDPLEKKVHVYRPGSSIQVLDNPTEISGDPLLKGLVLKLEGILD